MLVSFARLGVVLFSLVLGLTLCIFLLFWRKKKTDIGFVFFQYPLAAGFLYVLLESLHLSQFYDLFYLPQFPIDTIESLIFMIMGMTWILFCYAHYRLNNVSTAGIIPLPFIIALTVLNYLLFFFAKVIPTAPFYLKIISFGIASATLLYAGIIAFLILRIENRLLSSSWAGLTAAGIGLIYFPFVSLVDIFNLDISFFDPHRSLGIQVFPVYYFFLCAVIFGFIRHSYLIDQKNRKIDTGYLTKRETELSELLNQGLTNTEIAELLHISLYTVKTHIKNLYTKLDVHSRPELLDVLNRKKNP